MINLIKINNLNRGLTNEDTFYINIHQISFIEHLKNLDNTYYITMNNGIRCCTDKEGFEKILEVFKEGYSD